MFRFDLWFTACLVASAMPAWAEPGVGSFAPPLQFEPNRGQADESVRYLARAPGYTLLLGGDGSATYAMASGTAGEIHRVRLEIIGGQVPSGIRAEKRLSSTTHYYWGSGPGSQLHVPHYQRVRFSSVYEGIDLVWRTRRQDIEYAFRVASGADPARILLRFVGARRMWVGETGELIAETEAGTLKWQRPRAYLEGAAGSKQVAVEYRVRGDEVGFELGPYDLSAALVIDPMLTFSTLLGGTGFDSANSVTVGASGHVYVTGETSSSDFVMRRTPRRYRDAFVMKLDSSGTQLVYLAFLGGDGDSSGRAIAVDAAGDAYVTGAAPANFPVTSGAGRTVYGGLTDAFVLRLDPGGRLVYSTYLGGGSKDTGTGIAVDASGCAYVAGYTASPDFQTTAGAPQRTYGGGFLDGFLVKINNSGTGFVYSTLLGGTGIDQLQGVAVNAGGEACVAGYSDSPSIATPGAVQVANGGNGDGLVACVNSAGTAWKFVTYLGGAGPEALKGIALDAAGNIYVAGETFSDNFPVSIVAAQRVRRGDYDAFVVKLAPAGNAIAYATLLGGSNSEAANGLALDAAGHAWVAGHTASCDFPGPPVTTRTCYGGFDAFIAEVASDGGSLLWKTVLGGTADDRAMSIASAGAAGLFVAGVTNSVDFPLGAEGRPAAPAGTNGFLVRLFESSPPLVDSASPSSGMGTSGAFKVVFSDPNGATNLNAVYVLVNSLVTGAGGCLIEYKLAGNTLRLAVDSGVAWLNPTLQPSVAGTVENSQCRLDAGGSKVSSAGSNLTLTLSLTFKPAFAGTKAVLGYAYNNASLSSNWRTIGNWTVPGPGGPTVVSAAPNSGSGASAPFSLVFSDPNGAANLNSVYVLVNSLVTGAGGCLIEYNLAGNTLRLAIDSGVAWLNATLQPSVAGTVENSQCRLDAGGSRVSSAGNNLTLTVSLTFKPAFGGTKAVLGYAYNNASLSSNWRMVGNWTVPGPGGPTVVSAAPDSGSGASASFSLVFSDPNGAANLNAVYVLVNSLVTGAGGCLIEYNLAGNTLRLAADSGGTWFNPTLQPSVAGTLENSQCRLDAGGSKVSSAGNDLTLTVLLTFKPAFAGMKAVLGYAYNNASLSSNWRAVGNWNTGY